ncbi:TolC family protein [Photobacterium sanguinicancri]|uniref:TolC family protein n=1 Tax=Photobacterium sanguinicancri TaxID=875932 RepID=UPI0026E3BE90|nr:TolC family protein [Photobacterium sanguinicancri]MDO6499150.1 TolC family protein [Photobacterium sanguinicancri]
MPNRQMRNLTAKPLRLNRVMAGITLTCSVMVTTAFSPIVNALTLSDAWLAAKANEPQYLKSQIDVQIGEADVDRSRAELLPDVSASAGANWSDSNSDDLTGQYGIRLEQTIWDSTKWRTLDASEARLMSKALQTSAQKNALAEKVISAYLDVASSQAALNLAEQKYNESAKLLGLTEQRFKAGKIMATELEDTRASHVDDQASILTAKAQLLDNQASLANLINVMPDQVDEVNAVQLFAPPLKYQGEQHWLKMAKDNSPELLVALQNLKAAQIDKDTAKAGYYPTVKGNVGYRNETQSNNNDLYAGLNLSVPLDLNGSTSASVEKASLQILQAKQDVRAVEIQLKQDVQIRYRKLALDWQRVEMAQQQVNSRQQVLSSKQSVYGAGLIDSLEVIRAHNRLFDSKNALQVLLYQYWKNRAALLKAVGQLDDNAISMVSKALHS